MKTIRTKLEQLFNDHWEAWMRYDPLFATSCGDHRNNHLLPQVDEASYAAWLAQLEGFQARLASIPRSALEPAERLNYDYFSRMLAGEIAELRFRAYSLPISKTGGFHIYFPDMYLSMPFDSLGDYENYLARLNAIPTFFEQSIELMRDALQAGFTPARVTLEGVPESIAALIVQKPQESPFYPPFDQFPAHFSESERARLVDLAAKALQENVAPAYASLLKFMQEEYLPSARTTSACSDLPDGSDFYRHRIWFYTTLDLSPEEIHASGLAEVQRIRVEMEETIRRSDFTGDFQAFTQHLRSDGRYYAETPEALLKETALILKRIDGALPNLFKTLPRLPYGIQQVPEFQAPGATTGYYFPAPGDGSRAGFYYVNTYDLQSRPLYEMEALSLHEAVPGHHLQFALQQELRDLPEFRRFYVFHSYIEGWALYAERLGLEMGFYTDPASNFGRLSYEMWRACRLVVDTGLHALGWTRQQAIDFMAANTSLSLLNITNEVDRYIAWPGQALAYKIGEMKIRALRAKAENLLAEKFNRREFHDVILLGGSLPLDILEGRVDEWLAKTSTNQPGQPASC